MVFVFVFRDCLGVGIWEGNRMEGYITLEEGKGKRGREKEEGRIDYLVCKSKPL